MNRLFIVPLIVQLFGSCGQATRSVHDRINCNVAGYSFSLGENIQELKKDWTLEELKDLSFCDSIKRFSLTYEEHFWGFYFYNGKLIKVELCIPRSELDGHSVEIGGEIISLDKASIIKTVVKKSNYVFKCNPFNFEGMKDISIMFAYVDAEKILEEYRLNK